MTEVAPTSRVWRGGAPWTRSAVDAPPRDWLVLYLHAEAEPMRPTTTQHLRFLEHSLTPHNVLYWNAWHGVPAWIRSYPYDVVVLHYSVLCMRWEEPFERWRSSLDWIAASDAVRIAMPQDEYVCAATLDEWLMSAEYLLSEGNAQLFLCERGIRGFSDHARNTLDLNVVPAVKELSHLPIIVDPSHATGRRDLIPSMACAAVAAGADGVHVEVHSCPEKALSDGPQALLPRTYAELMQRIRKLAEVVGKTY